MGGLNKGKAKFVSAEALRAVLNYNADTGLFTWRIRRGPSAGAGSVAGSIQANGYRKIVVNGVMGWAHRWAWLYVHGHHAPANVDHVDGNPSNNAIRNLRLCNQSQNAANSKTRTTNKSGVAGVWLRPDTGKYVAYVTKDRRRVTLGCFSTLAEAATVRASEQKRIYGEFARV